MSNSSNLSRSWPESAPLSAVLKAGTVISGVDATENKVLNPTGLSDVLWARLEKFDDILDGVARHRPLDLPSLKLDTAFASLYVLERVHAMFQQDEGETASQSSSPSAKGGAEPPLIGTRDIAQMRTHLSVVYNWGTELLLERILPTLPNRRSPWLPPDAQIIDLTAAYEDYTLLFGVLTRLLTLLFPEGAQGRVSTSFVAKTILSRGFSDLLRPCICLGWLPNELCGDLPPALDLKPYTLRLLDCLPPSQTIASLGQILSKPANVPTYVGKRCSMFLSGQLLRPAGVAGLLSATFGEDVTSTDAPLVKLETVSKVLNSVPSNTPREVYFAVIIPRLLFLLTPGMSQTTPPAHKRAAAFTLSRMLTASTSGKAEGTVPDVRRCVLAWCLLDSLRPTALISNESNFDLETTERGLTEEFAKARKLARKLVIAPTGAVMTLSTILTNTDPSPDLISVLLGSIVPQLYILLEYLWGSKTADPTMRETVEGLLGTWARAASKEEVVNMLWKVVDGEGYEWVVDESGELCVTERAVTLPSLTLAQLADLHEGKLANEEDEDANPLNLSPHPMHFVKFLKSINREDVSSALYLRLLDAHVNTDNGGDPLRKILLLKLIMQVSSQIGESASAAEGSLKQPDVTHMLMFIRLSLDQDSALVDRGPSSGNLTLDSLHLVPGQNDEDGGDSDDEDLAPGLEGVDKNEHLSVTAVNLLLALLEEYPDLSPKTVPLLNEIYSQLEPLANSASDALRPRAREARLTLTARLASSFPSKSTKVTDVGEEGPQEKYQRALKLLQDPLLPVRAHGLLLLRELVAPAKVFSSKKKKNVSSSPGMSAGATISTVQGAEVAAPSVEPALVPAILSIFTQSIQDEDSYIFLNAVQGLAAMVDGFGKEVLRGLVDEYARGLDGVGATAAAVAMEAREVDKHVRVGEALGQVIRRCGKALGNYVDIIIPPVFAVVRAAHLPTTLRTSAVSLLATAADTNALALNAYINDLMSAMIDLVQVESVSASKAGAKLAPEETRGKSSASDAVGGGDVKGKEPSTSHKQEPGANQHHRNGPGGAVESIDGSGPGATDNANVNTMDAQPTVANPKFPPLRRAALHFLSLLIRAQTARMYEGELGLDLPGALMRHAGTVLGYVSATDADKVVRVMAREAAEQLDQLRGAMVGL